MSNILWLTSILFNDMKKLILTILFFTTLKVGYSQVLISLLFGDKLNSPNVEFGLDGGYNWAKINGLESYSAFSKLNLGFYFTLKMKQSAHWYIRTGVMVKSDRGTNKLTLEDINKIDSTYNLGSEGRYYQEIGYFDIPVLLRYRFNFKGFLEFGPQISLKNSATLYYTHKDGNDDVTVERSNGDQINTIDTGLIFGAGYSLREGKGVSFEIWYYHGLIDVYKHLSGTYSQALTAKITIPIGANKKQDPKSENKEK